MKDYLGDAVYASDEIHPAGIITLTTSSQYRDRPTLKLGMSFDIDNLTRPEVIEVMAALKAGRWERSESGHEGTLDYKATIDGVTVRLWAAAPPQSCRVVEEEYDIPASKGVRKRLICSKETPEETTDITA